MKTIAKKKLFDVSVFMRMRFAKSQSEPFLCTVAAEDSRQARRVAIIAAELCLGLDKNLSLKQMLQ